MILVIISDSGSAASFATISAAQKLGKIEILHSNNNADIIGKYVAKSADKYSHIIAPHNSFGREVIGHISGYISLPSINNVSEIIDSQTFKRPIYAGELIETVEYTANIKLLTINIAAFDKSPQDINIEPQELQGESNVTHISSDYNNDIDLSSAEIVVCGGVGVGSLEGFDELKNYASKLGACDGATLAAINAGYSSSEKQVGQTGTIVAPKIYLGLGVSGAIQHISGIRNSKVIFAVNTDESAPILEHSDYYYIGDWRDVI